MVSRATIGQLINGDYDFLDTSSPHTHGNEKDKLDPEKDVSKKRPADSVEGPFGSYGIFRLKSFTGADGKLHEGVGVHSGRASKGCSAKTEGCVRSTDEAMKLIKKTVVTDPLTKMTVKNNRENPPAVRGKQADAAADPGSFKLPRRPIQQ